MKKVHREKELGRCSIDRQSGIFQAVTMISDMRAL